MKRVTIQEVAKELNLSRNTVAKALNNSDTVAYDTRYLVIEKAYEMGYTKLSPAVLNEFRLTQKNEQPKTIAVLTRREISVFWNRIIMGISDELNRSNCKLQLEFISEEDEAACRIPADLQGEVSALLVLSVFKEEFIKRIAQLKIPTVFLDMPSDPIKRPKEGDVIICESFYSTQHMVQDLLEHGARQLAFIGDISYCKTIFDRYDGYTSAISKAGLPVQGEYTAIRHMPKRYYTSSEVEAAIDSFPAVPDAIVCANDDIAMDAVRILRARGLRVPEDVAITGYDNIEEMVQVEPFLTTVRVGNQRLGRRLVQQLLWRLNNPEFPQEITHVDVEVIFRESSRFGGTHE